MYGNDDRVLLVDPEAVIQALKEKELLSKNLLNYRSLARFIGNGLVTLTGKQHTEHRRIIQPAFHFQVNQLHLHFTQIFCIFNFFNFVLEFKKFSSSFC